MSHFCYVFSSADHGYFGFGKETGETQQVFEAAILAAQCNEFPDLVRVFMETYRQHWSWVLSQEPKCLLNFMDWVQPSATYTCLSGAGDLPWVKSNEPEWWPCCGALGSPNNVDMFDYVGYFADSMHNRDAHPRNKLPRSGHMKQAGYDELAKVAKQHKIAVDGIDLAEDELGDHMRAYNERLRSRNIRY